MLYVGWGAPLLVADFVRSFFCCGGRLTKTYTQPNTPCCLHSEQALHPILSVIAMFGLALETWLAKEGGRKKQASEAGEDWQGNADRRKERRPAGRPLHSLEHVGALLEPLCVGGLILFPSPPPSCSSFPRYFLNE